MYEIPLIFALIGLALYCILGGADFGAGFWQLTAGRGERGDQVTEKAHDSMSPVWEANHVWLIFVLTVVWTSYPKAFGSIASTLSLALAIAALGILIRGAAYALRTGAANRREQRSIDSVLGASSVIAPFALGAAVGGIASGRVPVGNAQGDLVTSWLNPTSIVIGVLAVVTGAYIAAVFLCGDSVRTGDRELAERFRARALGSGVIAGVIAVAGLVVVHSDARQLFDHLFRGAALAAMVVSVLAGTATLALVYRRRFEPARVTAALAVAAIVAGWALAQNPQFLPGLTVRQAAAPHATQVAVVVAIIAGGLILFPSLGTLFRLTLGGRFESEATEATAADSAPTPPARAHGPHEQRHRARAAGALLVAGIAFTNIADAEWAHLVGAACLLAFIVLAFLLAVPYGPTRSDTSAPTA